MAQNARNHARVCLLGLEYLIITLVPYLPTKCQILAQNRQLQVKMLKHKSTSILESAEPIDSKD